MPKKCTAYRPKVALTRRVCSAGALAAHSGNEPPPLSDAGDGLGPGFTVGLQSPLGASRSATARRAAGLASRAKVARGASALAAAGPAVHHGERCRQRLAGELVV
jgi:hypothetical protein